MNQGQTSDTENQTARAQKCASCAIAATGSKEDEKAYFAKLCTVALRLAPRQDTFVGKGLLNLTCAIRTLSQD